MAKDSWFDAPIPGESLTATPGNAKYEHPPRFADPREAIDHVYKQIMKSKNVYSVISMLKSGMPVEGITKTILMAGFAEGAWTPDVAMLIAKPVMAQVAAIGKAAGIQNMKMALPRKDGKDAILKKAATARALAMSEETEPVVAPEPKTELGGFMGRK
jgi:hypothetical protein